MLKINFARDAWGFNLLWIGEKRVRLFWKIVKIMTEGQGKAEWIRRYLLVLESSFEANIFLQSSKNLQRTLWQVIVD